MRIAVMQPYLFPYIGYFQLVKAVDTFVFFDDVNFIKRGFIHRNTISANGKRLMFSLPLSGASQNMRIKDVEIHQGQYEKWWKKFQHTLKMNYASAPFFDQVMAIVHAVLDKPPKSISAHAAKSIELVSEYLGLTKTFKFSSEIDYSKECSAQEKILSICEQLGAREYVNPIGGSELYQKEIFDAQGTTLYFLKSTETEYPQKTTEFLATLSILDVLMYNEVTNINDMLLNHKLLQPN